MSRLPLALAATALIGTATIVAAVIMRGEPGSSETGPHDPAALRTAAPALPDVSPSASAVPNPTPAVSKPLLQAHRRPIASFDELVRDRPNVVIATVVRQLDDHWPASGGAETLVASRFVLRVESVLSGELQPGAELVLQPPGGTTKNDGVAATGGSARPKPGDETTVVEFADWPMFDVGSTELIFLYKGTTESGEAGWGAVPEGRYVLRDGTFETIFPGGPPQNVVLARDITSRIVGRSAAEVLAEVNAAQP